MNSLTCNFTNSNGKRCQVNARWRLHFSIDHPFDHHDCCEEHMSEYHGYCWKQEIYWESESVK
jgi:hypothetical protein